MPRVLIVDDEESMRLLLARIVSEDVKAEVQLAGTCEQALRLAQNGAYDAIVLDLLMPGIGGRAVLSEIRHASANRATPVLIVSQVADKETIKGCMAAGASAYHVKPVKRAGLVKSLKKWLTSRSTT